MVYLLDHSANRSALLEGELILLIIKLIVKQVQSNNHTGTHVRILSYLRSRPLHHAYIITWKSQIFNSRECFILLRKVHYYCVHFHDWGTVLCNVTKMNSCQNKLATSYSWTAIKVV